MDCRNVIPVPVPVQGRSNGDANFVYRILDRIRRQMSIALRGGRMIVPKHFADDR